MIYYISKKVGKMKEKNFKFLNIIIILFLLFGCSNKEVDNDEIVNEGSANSFSELMDYKEALEIFEEGKTAEVFDIETGITYKVRRVVGGFKTIGDVETVSMEDNELFLESVGGDWSIIRRAVILTIGDLKIPASIAAFPHSGSEEYPYGDIIDNRSGQTGTGINLDSIRDNGMIGVVDIYFLNSTIPGLSIIDERHQEMVIKAYEYGE